MTAQARQTPLVPPRKERKLVDLMRVVVRKSALETNVAYPCEVVSFDKTSQLVEVRVDFAEVLADDRVELELPPMTIPNLLLSTMGQGDSGGGYLSFPVLPGHKGHVTVFDRSIDRWRTRGEAGDPRLRHTHSRIDGVFTPGLRDKSRAIPNFDQAAAVLEHAQIKLGENATLGAARTTDKTAADVTMLAWMTSVTTALGFLGATIPPPTDFGVITGGSTKVKIE